MEGKWFKELCLLDRVQVLVSKAINQPCPNPDCEVCEDVSDSEDTFCLLIEYWLGSDYYVARAHFDSIEDMEKAFESINNDDIESLYMGHTGLEQNWAFN